MWRLTALSALSVLLVFSGCRRQDRLPVEVVEEPPAGIASTLFLANPATAFQLVKGFHDVEQNHWRWTRCEFSATLRPPKGADTRGASLILKFSLHELLARKKGPVTLKAKVDGQALPAETYREPGDYLYRKDVPPASLVSDAVAVEFALDKCLLPGEADHRELGLIATLIGFEAK